MRVDVNVSVGSSTLAIAPNTSSVWRRRSPGVPSVIYGVKTVPIPAKLVRLPGEVVLGSPAGTRISLNFSSESQLFVGVVVQTRRPIVWS